MSYKHVTYFTFVFVTINESLNYKIHECFLEQPVYSFYACFLLINTVFFAHISGTDKYYLYLILVFIVIYCLIEQIEEFS